VKEAEQMAREAVKGRERVLGVKVQVTLEIVWLLGQVCEKLDMKGEAKGLYKQADVDGRALLGESHVGVGYYRRGYERLRGKG
jgi:hypothetical protein